MEARYNFKNKLKTHVNSSSSHILEIKIRNSDLPSILLFPPPTFLRELTKSF